MTTHEINVLHPLAARTAADHAFAILDGHMPPGKPGCCTMGRFASGQHSFADESSPLAPYGRLTVNAYAGSLAQTSGVTLRWGLDWEGEVS